MWLGVDEGVKCFSKQAAVCIAQRERERERGLPVAHND